MVIVYVSYYHNTFHIITLHSALWFFLNIVDMMSAYGWNIKVYGITKYLFKYIGDYCQCGEE